MAVKSYIVLSQICTRIAHTRIHDAGVKESARLPIHIQFTQFEAARKLAEHKRITKPKWKHNTRLCWQANEKNNKTIPSHWMEWNEKQILVRLTHTHTVDLWAERMEKKKRKVSVPALAVRKFSIMTCIDAEKTFSVNANRERMRRIAMCESWIRCDVVMRTERTLNMTHAIRADDAQLINQCYWAHEIKKIIFFAPIEGHAALNDNEEIIT